jgi:hypothetical protein
VIRVGPARPVVHEDNTITLTFDDGTAWQSALTARSG